MLLEPDPRNDISILEGSHVMLNGVREKSMKVLAPMGAGFSWTFLFCGIRALIMESRFRGGCSIRDIHFLIEKSHCSKKLTPTIDGVLDSVGDVW